MYKNSQTPHNLSYLRTIMDNIHDMVMLVGVKPDDVYQVLYVNRALLQAVGYTEANVLGKEVAEVLGESPELNPIKHYRKVVKAKQTVVYSARRKYPAGTMDFEVKLLPVLNSVGECVQIICITREQPSKGV